MMATSLSVALFPLILVYFATLTEVIVAELQTILVEVLRDTGTALKGMKFLVTQRNLQTMIEDDSLPEIGGVG